MSRISNDFLKFIYQISIKFWNTNTLLHKVFFFQTDMIFFDQFNVPMIKFEMLCGVYDTDSLAYEVWQLRICYDY